MEPPAARTTHHRLAIAHVRPEEPTRQSSKLRLSQAPARDAATRRTQQPTPPARDPLRRSMQPAPASPRQTTRRAGLSEDAAQPAPPARDPLRRSMQPSPRQTTRRVGLVVAPVPEDAEAPPGATNSELRASFEEAHREVRASTATKGLKSSMVAGTLRRVVQRQTARGAAPAARAKARAAEKRGDELVAFKLVGRKGKTVAEKDLTFEKGDLATWWKVLKRATEAFAPCPDGLDLFRPDVGASDWGPLLAGARDWASLPLDRVTGDMGWTRGLEAWAHAAAERDRATASALAGGYRDALASGDAEKRRAALNQLREFAHRRESLEAVSDDLLHAAVAATTTEPAEAAACLWTLCSTDAEGLRTRLVKLHGVGALVTVMETTEDEAALKHATGCLVALAHWAPEARSRAWGARAFAALARAAASEDPDCQLLAARGLYAAVRASGDARRLLVAKNGFHVLAKLARSRSTEADLLAVACLGVLATSLGEDEEPAGADAAFSALADLCLWCLRQDPAPDTLLACAGAALWAVAALCRGSSAGNTLAEVCLLADGRDRRAGGSMAAHDERGPGPWARVKSAVFKVDVASTVLAAQKAAKGHDAEDQLTSAADQQKALERDARLLVDHALCAAALGGAAAALKEPDAFIAHAASKRRSPAARAAAARVVSDYVKRRHALSLKHVEALAALVADEQTPPGARANLAAALKALAEDGAKWTPAQAGALVKAVAASSGIARWEALGAAYTLSKTCDAAAGARLTDAGLLDILAEASSGATGEPHLAEVACAAMARLAQVAPAAARAWAREETCSTWARELLLRRRADEARHSPLDAARYAVVAFLWATDHVAPGLVPLLWRLARAKRASRAADDADASSGYGSSASTRLGAASAWLVFRTTTRSKPAAAALAFEGGPTVSDAACALLHASRPGAAVRAALHALSILSAGEGAAARRAARRAGRLAGLAAGARGPVIQREALGVLLNMSVHAKAARAVATSRCLDSLLKTARGPEGASRELAAACLGNLIRDRACRAGLYRRRLRRGPETPAAVAAEPGVAEAWARALESAERVVGEDRADQLLALRETFKKPLAADWGASKMDRDPWSPSVEPGEARGYATLAVGPGTRNTFLLARTDKQRLRLAIKRTLRKAHGGARASLCVFKAVDGARVDVSETFEFEGERVHVYHASPLRAEVVAPGPWAPGLPDVATPELDATSRDLPEAPAPGAVEPLDPDHLPASPAPEPPPLDRHYMPHLQTAAALTEAGSIPFGALPRAAPVIVARKRAPERERVEPEEWTPEKSVFVERGANPGTSKLVYRRLLKRDMRRLQVQATTRRLLRRLCGDDARAPLRSVEDALFPGLLRLYPAMLAACDAFAARDMSDGEPEAGPGRGAFLALCAAAKLCDDVAFPEAKAAPLFGQAVGGGTSLRRHQVVELILRIADAKYAVSARNKAAVKRGAAVSGADCGPPLDRLRTEHLDLLGIEPPEAYRAERLYARPVEDVLYRHQRVLRAVHSALGGLRPRSGQPCFDLGAWMAFLESTGLLISELSREDARLCFLNARLRAPDEAEDDRRSAEALDFPGFLEAICRAVDAAQIPAPEALREAGAASVTDFFEKVAELWAGDDDAKARAADLLAWNCDPATPLGPKLDLMLPYALQNLAVTSGKVDAGGAAGAVDLQGYLTQRQRESWIGKRGGGEPRIRRASVLQMGGGDLRATYQQAQARRTATLDPNAGMMALQLMQERQSTEVRQAKRSTAAIDVDAGMRAMQLINERNAAKAIKKDLGKAQKALGKINLVRLHANADGGSRMASLRSSRGR